MQLKTIKNQLDPHFTLNTLNTIGILIKKDETEKAALLFDRFSKMTRQILMSGNKIKVSLKEELAFIENYLEIQKFRFDNGIGREESAKYKKYSTGKGLVIAREMVDLYNRLNNTHITFIFVDLDEGVEVRVWI